MELIKSTEVDFGIVGWVKLFRFPNLSHLFKLIERFVDVLLLELHVLFSFGMPVWGMFQGILVGGIPAIEVLLFFFLGHEKGFGQLWVLLFENFSVVGRQTGDVVWNAELCASLCDFFFDDFLFRNLYLFFKTLLLLGLLLGKLFGYDLFHLRSARLDEFSEEDFHVFLVFLFHQFGESF